MSDIRVTSGRDSDGRPGARIELPADGLDAQVVRQLVAQAASGITHPTGFTTELPGADPLAVEALQRFVLSKLPDALREKLLKGPRPGADGLAEMVMQAQRQMGLPLPPIEPLLDRIRPDVRMHDVREGASIRDVTKE